MGVYQSGQPIDDQNYPYVDLGALAGTILAVPTAWGTAASGEVQGVNASLFAGSTGLTTTPIGSPAVACLNVYDPAAEITLTAIEGFVDGLTYTVAGSPAVSSLNVFITGTEVGSGGGFQYQNGTTPASPYGTAALGIDVNGEVHILNVDTYGNELTSPAAPATSQLSFAAINVAVGAGSGNQTIVAGSSGKTVRIFEIDLQVSGLGSSSSTITFKDGTSTALTGPYFALEGFIWSRDNNGDPVFITSSGNAFVINNSTAAQLSGYVKYQQS